MSVSFPLTLSTTFSSFYFFVIVGLMNVPMSQDGSGVPHEWEVIQP
jgi:hypothetical protein